MLSDELVRAIAGEATIVTATRRLARWIAAAHDGAQRAAGRTAWRPADVLPWPAWLRRSWLQLRDWCLVEDGERLLTGAQANVLWRRVLADLPPLQGTVLPGDAAGACRRSWALSRAWAIEPRTIAAEGGEDARLFARAAAAYAELCRGGSWVDAGALPWRLAEAAAGPLPGILPSRVVFVGFDRKTPDRARLVEAMRAAGVRVDELATAAIRHEARPVRVSCDDPDGELKAAAGWARAVLGAQPEASIGLVLAQPEERLERVAEILDDALSPARILPGSAAEPPRWNVYLDRPLDDWPVVTAALGALTFACDGAQLKDLGQLLRSPWLAGGRAEAPARARLDAWLRRAGYYELTLGELLTALAAEGRSPPPACPVLREGLAEAAALTADASTRDGAEGWARQFGRLLAALGWPGGGLDSDAYQTVRRWREALVEFGGLDGLLGRMNAREALAELRRLARETVFQPEALAAPVQVTGLLDAAGLGFDACWVAGLHDGALPRPLAPDPLLPAGLQRHLGMPRADAGEEREFARRTLDALACCAPRVTFSAPWQEDDRELRPSPLLERVPAAAPPPPMPNYARRLFGARALETLSDFRLGPGTAEAGGGTDLIQQQAACPFRAQAVYRLRAEPLEAPGAGVDRRQAGALVHRALERLWARWGDRSGLPSPVHALREIDAVLADLVRALPRAVRLGRERLLEIERERLTGLIAEFLEIDRQRPPFGVERREHECQARLGPLELSLRIDRIDRTGDGRLLVIDYKTGSAAVGGWLSERMESPQLPIYALALGEEVAAVAVGSIRAGAVGYVGLGSGADTVPGVKSVADDRAAARVAADWPALIGLWRERLEAIAAEHHAGEAAVRPRSPQACRYCHLTTLCRRHELAAEETDDDGA